ncbi:hypothetical protein BZA77DRAFT_276262 [Pyronema omphalodes]|nr:hypothetical protein BZA77DRAFT_276262 [Pyronema omphalodes]
MTWALQQLRLPIATPTSVPRIDFHLKIIILLLLVFLIKAAPIPVIEPETTDWVDTPKERGTLTIIFSCGTALGLCVWTGVHLNVDPSASGGYKQSTIETVSRLLGKLVWALIALFAPDIVLTVAVHQFLVAYEYQQAKKKHMEPKKQMELKMAFFATMGGFCIEEMTVDGPRWKSLKVDTLRRLRTMDIIHDYPLSEIDDKSKASGIAKILVCFQTGWILLQCLARHLNGLHITMLEMNTAVHVLFAIVMYGVWWRKPFDVAYKEAFDAANETARASFLAAFRAAHPAALKSESEFMEGHNLPTDRNTPDTSAAPGIPSPNSLTGATEPDINQLGLSEPTHNTTDLISMFSTSTPQAEALQGFIGRSASSSVPHFAELVSEAKKTTEKTFRQHFDRAAADFDTNIGVTSDIVERSTATGIFIAAQKAIETAKKTPPHAACRSNSTIPSIVPRVLGVFYGAMHMLKWNSDWFPTPIEHLLWKIACVAGSAAVLPIGVMSLIPFISSRHNYYRIFLLILCTCLWVLFGIARFYIIAESFISLRKLPVEAYEMPSWTNSMPHI